MKKNLLSSFLLALMVLLGGMNAWAGDKNVVKYSFDDANSPKLTAGNRAGLDYSHTSVVSSTAFLNIWGANNTNGATNISLGNKDLSSETWTLQFDWAGYSGCNGKPGATALMAGSTTLFTINDAAGWGTTMTLVYGESSTTISVAPCSKSTRISANVANDYNKANYWFHFTIVGSSEGVKLTVKPSNGGDAILTDAKLYDTNINPTSLALTPGSCGGVGIDELLLTYYVEGEVIEEPEISYTKVDGSSRTIAATCETENASICYSTDGEKWTEGDEITVSESTKIYFKAVKGTAQSEVVEFDAEAGTEITLNAPTITRSSEGFATISSNQNDILLRPDAIINYTYGTESGTFTGTKEIAIIADATITAYASYEGYKNSKEVSRPVAGFPADAEIIQDITSNKTYSAQAWGQTATASGRTYAASMFDSKQWGENIYFENNGTWGFRNGNKEWYVNGTAWLLFKKMKKGNIIILNCDAAATNTVNATYAEKYSFGNRYAYVVENNGNVELELKRISGSVNNYFRGITIYKVASVSNLPMMLKFPDFNETAIASYLSDDAHAWNVILDDDPDQTWTLCGFNNQNNAWDYVACGRKNAAQEASVVSPSITTPVTHIVLFVKETANVKQAVLEVTDEYGESVEKDTIKGENFTAGEVAFAVQNAIANCKYKVTIFSAAGANGSTKIDSIGVYDDYNPESDIMKEAKKLAADENAVAVGKLQAAIEAGDETALAAAVEQFKADNADVDGKKATEVYAALLEEMKAEIAKAKALLAEGSEEPAAIRRAASENVQKALADAIAAAEAALTSNMLNINELDAEIAKLQAAEEAFVAASGAQEVAVELTHTGAVQGGSNEAGTSLDTETHYYNNWGSQAWAGQAYAGFKWTLPAGSAVTSATLKFYSNCGGSRDGRTVDVYALDGTGFDFNNLTLSAATGTKVGSATDNRTVEEKTFDVTEAVKALVAAGSSDIVFAFGGAAAGATLYGKASADKAPQLIIEAVSASSTTSYQVNFVDAENNVLKQAAEYTAQLKGAEVTASAQDMAAFKSEDGSKKYIYVSGNATITLDGDATKNVINLVFREAAKYKYTVNAINDGAAQLAVIKEGEDFEGEEITVPTPRRINFEGTIYTSGKANNTESSVKVALDADNKNVELEYTATEVTNAIFFAEAEDIKTLTATTSSNIPVRCSMKAGAFAAEAAKIVTLSAGTYKIAAACFANNSTNFVFAAGDNTVFTVTGTGSEGEVTGEEFTLTAETTITMVGGNANNALDYLYIASNDGQVVEEPVAEGPIYSWESVDGTPVEQGGKITYENGDGDRLNYQNADYYTICLNGKKANINDETASANAGYMLVTLDQALNAGDQIKITAYVNKNASKVSSAYILFENGAEAESEAFGDESNIDATFGNAPTTKTVEVSAEAAGSKSFKMTRGQTGTNLFITKLEIVKAAGPATGINTVKANAFENGAIYNLRGQKVTNPTKGLYIINGKKVVIK